MTAGTPTSDLGEASAREGSGLARAAVGGVAWQGLSYLGGKVLVLATTVVLARLLAPSDFGVVGLALVFIAYAEVVTDLGVAQALIYLPEKREANDAAFVVTLLFSSVLVGVAMLAAPTVAGFFRRPDVTSLFRVLSLSLLVGGIGQVPDALLRKGLLFRRRLIADVTRSAGQGVVSIALAAAGAGPWSIVYGYLAGGALWAAMAWALVSYRPGRRFWRVRWGQARQLLSYGVAVAGNALLLSLVFDIDYLIVGRKLGPSSLGHYTLGFRIPEMAIINVFYVLSAVAFPLFSLARGDMDRLRRGYLATIRLQAVYGVAAGVGMAAVAPMLVHVVFGPKWEPSIVPLQALALYAAFRSLGIGAVDVYKAIGRPGLAAALSFVRLAVLAPILLLAVRYGIDGVSWAQAAVAFVLAVSMQVVASRVLGLPPKALGGALFPALAAGAGTAVGALAVRLWMPGGEPVRLAVAMVAGGLVGLAALQAVDPGFLKDLRGVLGSRRTAADVTPGSSGG
jgi:O-antigen/teichoic acid export membrane protein